MKYLRVKLYDMLDYVRIQNFINALSETQGKKEKVKKKIIMQCRSIKLS